MGVLQKAEDQCSLNNESGRPVWVGSTVGYEIHEFLAWEAHLLDQRRYEHWLTLLAKDLVYRCPVHMFACSPDPAQGVDRDYDFIAARIAGMVYRGSASKGNANAPMQVRRLVTNILVTSGHRLKEYEVASYVLVACRPHDGSESKLLTVERRDCLRRLKSTIQLVHRTVTVATIPEDVRECIDFL